MKNLGGFGPPARKITTASGIFFGPGPLVTFFWNQSGGKRKNWGKKFLLKKIKFPLEIFLRGKKWGLKRPLDANP